MKRGDPLSPREFQVMKAVLAGKSRIEISRTCFISESAIGAHMYRVRHKLGAKTTMELAKKVAEMGIDRVPVFNPATDMHLSMGRIPMMLYVDDNNS